MIINLLRLDLRRAIDLATDGQLEKVFAVAERRASEAHVVAGIERGATPPCRSALAVILLDDEGDVRGLETFEFEPTQTISTVIAAIAVTDSAAALSVDVIRKIGVPLLTANHGDFDWRIG